MTKQRYRVPAFAKGESDGTTDFCTERGAHVLAARIRAAWAKVGVPVETEVFPIARGKDGHPIFGVRMPGLVNGLPVAP